MTTLVGLHIPGEGVWIGSDSMMSAGHLQMPSGPKWAISNNWALGVAGCARTVELIEHHKADVLHSQLPFEVCCAIGELMKTYGYVSEEFEGGGPVGWGQAFLLANGDGLWAIDCTLSVQAVPAHTLWAQGSGVELALGAGMAAQALGCSARQRMEIAIEAACRFDSCSSLPLFVKLLPVM